ASIDPVELTDDLWALALSRLPQLASHFALVAAQAAAPHPHVSPQKSQPLQGAALQPWHALLAVASWLSDETRLPPDPDPPRLLAEGGHQNSNAYHALVAYTTARPREMPRLYDRLLRLARNLHPSDRVLGRSDITVLVLRALY